MSVVTPELTGISDNKDDVSLATPIIWVPAKPLTKVDSPAISILSPLTRLWWDGVFTLIWFN